MPDRGPYSIGGAPWNGLSKLIDEAGEVVQVAGKIIGSGGATVHWDGTNLKERLEDEMADLLAACDFVIERNGLSKGRLYARANEKTERFEEWNREQVELPKEPGNG